LLFVCALILFLTLFFRLRQVISDLEAEYATLVRPEIVEKHMETIDGLQADLRMLDHTHKQLIVRYCRLKGAIEAASADSNKDTAGMRWILFVQ
jgi:hypothetical protein